MRASGLLLFPFQSEMLIDFIHNAGHGVRWLAVKRSVDDTEIWVTVLLALRQSCGEGHKL